MSQGSGQDWGAEGGCVPWIPLRTEPSVSDLFTEGSAELLSRERQQMPHLAWPPSLPGRSCPRESPRACLEGACSACELQLSLHVPGATYILDGHRGSLSLPFFHVIWRSFELFSSMLANICHIDIYIPPPIPLTLGRHHLSVMALLLAELRGSLRILNPAANNDQS